MINTFKVVNRKIELPTYDEKVSIYFFGDIHRFAKSCDVDRWHWFLKKAREHVEQDPDRVFFFGMGDYDDFASTREKADLSKMHETTIETFDEMNETRTRVLAKEMSFMRGKVLGLIEGNHHWVYVNGGTTTMDLASRLEAEYLGWLCHYTLRFEFANRNTRPCDVHFVLCHGKAGGKTAGITINQVSDMKLIFPVANVFAMGHDHQRGAWPQNVLVPSKKSNGETKIKQLRQFLCRSGSFKKAYEANTAGYEIGRLLKPADLGAIRLDFSFHRDRKDGNDDIILDITSLV